MRKIEHIGIAVKSMDESLPIYEQLLNTKCYKIEEVESEGVKTAFFKIGESKIELLEATNNDSPIAKYLAKRGAGMHHIAYDVADIFSEIVRLQKAGFTLIQASPKRGADNKLIAFLHPKSTAGTLVELCQERTD
jgi:methylmalonyl-CoA/ethylmalonyl-CoA epimerase